MAQTKTSHLGKVSYAIILLYVLILKPIFFMCRSIHLIKMKISELKMMLANEKDWRIGSGAGSGWGTSGGLAVVLVVGGVPSLEVYLPYKLHSYKQQSCIVWACIRLMKVDSQFPVTYFFESG